MRSSCNSTHGDVNVCKDGAPLPLALVATSKMPERESAKVWYLHDRLNLFKAGSKFYLKLIALAILAQLSVQGRRSACLPLCVD
jgi:hypothetical protein